jgi:hypothetical protein
MHVEPFSPCSQLYHWKVENYHLPRVFGGHEDCTNPSLRPTCPQLWTTRDGRERPFDSLTKMSLARGLLFSAFNKGSDGLVQARTTRSRRERTLTRGLLFNAFDARSRLYIKKNKRKKSTKIMPSSVIKREGSCIACEATTRENEVLVFAHDSATLVA